MDNDKCLKLIWTIQYCTNLKNELKLKKEFEEIAPGIILSLSEKQIINYCPFCGTELNH